MPYLDEEYKVDCEYKITYDTLEKIDILSQTYRYINSYIDTSLVDLQNMYKCKALNGKMVLLVRADKVLSTLGTILTKKLCDDLEISYYSWFKIVLPVDFDNLTSSNSNGDALTLDHTEYSIGE